MLRNGNLTLTFDTTGGPGDRNCYASGSNTDFTNGSVSFLNASALSMTYSGSPVYIGSTTPSSISLPVQNTPSTGGSSFVLGWNIIGILNPAAPSGTYTSTLTITLSNTSL